MKYACPIILTIIFLLPTACKKDDIEPSRSSGKESEIYYNTLDRATKAFEKENYDETEKLINRAITLSPGMPMAYYMYGMMLIHKNEHLKAGENFEKALDRSTLSEKSRLISEIDTITGFIADEDDVKAFNQASELADAGKHAQSLLISNKLLAKYPYNTDILYISGNSGIRSNNKNSYNNLEKALKIHPGHKPSLEALINYYKENKSVNNLTKYYERYIDYYGESADICTDYAIHIYNSGDSEKALVLFDHYIDKFPDQIINHFYAGKIYFSLDKKELSIKNLNTFVQKSKDSSSTTAQFKEAKEILEKLL